MNNRFKSFFFYYVPFIFLILIFVPILILYQYPHLENIMYVSITVLFLLSAFTLCGQALYLSYDAKNNKRLLLILPLFILSIFYIPFYYSKYIEKRYSKMPIFSLIFNLCIIGIACVLVNNLYKPKNDTYHKVVSDDKVIVVNFPKSFNKCSYSDTYDLECFDETNNLTTMIVNYKLDEINYDNKMVDIVSSYADILHDKDETLERISEPVLKTINDKDIYQVVYRGTSEGVKYNFILSSILIKNDDILSLAIQVVEVDNYDKSKKELFNILKSIIKEAN